MDVDDENSLALLESTAEMLDIGAHGSHRVDTTALTGALVTMPITFRAQSIRTCRIDGVAHDLDLQLVLRDSREQYELHSVSAVRAALPNNPARERFDLEYEALCLRNKLSTA